MRELAHMLHILCHSKQQRWMNYLSAIEYLHNNVIHALPGQMPTEVLKGTFVREHSLRPDYFVLVRVHNVSNQAEFITKKLLPAFSGSYRISKSIRENCMELVGEDNDHFVGRFNVNQLK
ncbi:hypothetical protein PR048_027086 [Dryococelus australis]|uniref:Uncharacterized protein n=1 Tax=Dryococelus australis TaxID=614101 RepID=A0ABQ9GEG8_9NEOP|nr:hypothetical protein PR048_027086 [Dryococelus australis]